MGVDPNTRGLNKWGWSKFQKIRPWVGKNGEEGGGVKVKIVLIVFMNRKFEKLLTKRL